MNDETHLDCKIYVETPLERHELLSAIGNLLSGSERVNTIYTSDLTIDVLYNSDRDEKHCKDFPDGFLFFRYCIEIYPVSGHTPESRKRIILEMLNYLWSQSWPAVAACDYENELPNNGGYKSPLGPWPK